jgi:predicted lipoprotein
MQFYMFWKLPAAWFMGLRVQHCDMERCEVSLPFRWRSQNPFRSIYFAAECAAAEMSTGLLAMAHIQEAGPMSMLVTNIEATFIKKADQKLVFTCSEGRQIQEIIKKTLETGQPQIYQATSIGLLPTGQEAARVVVTWSFKRKNNL